MIFRSRMMKIIASIALSFYLIGSSTTLALAKSVDMFIPENGYDLSLPNILVQSFDEGAESIDNEKFPSTSASASNETNTLSSCRVYLAPSTIPGAGMGVFAGQPFNVGDEVTTPDAVVPLVDVAWNNGVEEMSNTFLWDEYVWTQSGFKGMKDADSRIIDGASFGIGALPNCFFPLLNVEDTETSRDNAAIESGVDPGSGAFTVFHDRRGLATRDIRPGEEIFVDYGYGYFEHRQEDYASMPLLEDYVVADKLLERFRKVSQKVKEQDESTYDIGESHDILDDPLATVIQSHSSEEFDKISYNRLLEFSHQYDSIKQLIKQNETAEANHDESKASENKLLETDLYELLLAVMKTWPSRTQSALPTSTDSVNYVLDELGSTGLIHTDRSIRDMNWLYTHGSCLDHLVVRNSTIPYAGRGAFANKFLPKGTIVAPVPLIHLPERNVLNMHSSYITPSGSDYKRNESDVIHHQLLLNYCFGHQKSSLLLCPYGIASSLVNHGSTEKNQANTRIIWSDKATSQPKWFDLPLDQWAYKYKAGLAFDYVAIRDIHEGEEVLVDYGDEWQAAWDAHVSNWTPKPFKSQLLNDIDPPVEIPTHKEWPWPEIHLWCRNMYREFHGLLPADDYAYPCKVVAKALDKTKDEILYTVELVYRYHSVFEDKDDNMRFCREEFDEILFDLPRDAFIFGGSFDWAEHNRYYSETWSFRHHLQIPDDIMPEKWKNLS